MIERLKKLWVLIVMLATAIKSLNEAIEAVKGFFEEEEEEDSD